jgi:transcription elongation factor Elf1
MKRATITEAWVMPYDWTALARCPECGERNQWTCRYDEPPQVHYCRCPECQALYTMRVTRRWLDVAAKWRGRPFSVIRAEVAR